MRLKKMIENDVLGKFQRPLALYVHIPFCVAKCGYCDFLSFPLSSFSDKEELMRRYVQALCLEIQRLPHAGSRLDSIYIGGGTPSVLPYGAVKQIMKCIKECYRLVDDCEISMEVNPGTLAEQRIAEYKEAGINRISIGMQSLDDNVLRLSERRHSKKQGIESFYLLRNAGFSNINLDLIVGLPGSTRSNLLETVEGILALAPEHISLYSLILEEGSKFYQSYITGSLSLPEEDETLAMQRRGIDELTAAAYIRYEISNFAKEGYLCRHNLHVWNGHEYLAAGVGASSALFEENNKLLRFKNDKDLFRYIRKVEEGIEVRTCEEQVDKTGQMFERLMLGLRLSSGINATDFHTRFGEKLEEVYLDAISSNEGKGLLRWEGEYLMLTQKGMEWQNQVLLAFMS